VQVSVDANLNSGLHLEKYLLANTLSFTVPVRSSNTPQLASQIHCTAAYQQATDNISSRMSWRQIFM
jgi:hypothetical protein